MTVVIVVKFPVVKQPMQVCDIKAVISIESINTIHTSYMIMIVVVVKYLMKASTILDIYKC